MSLHRPAWLDAGALLRAAPFLFLILLAAGLSYRYHTLLRDQRDRVDHTDQVIAQLQTVLVNTIDAETGQRGYLLTGDGRYLNPYRYAVDDVPKSLDALRVRVEDSATQVARVDTLRRLVQVKFDELRSTVVARDAAGFDAARAIVLEDRGRASMDAFRETIATMQQSELTLPDERTRAARATERRLLLSTLVCAALSSVARIGLALTGRRRTS